MTSALVEHVKRSEGLRLTAYRDIAGVWTIGWGHAMDGPCPSITREEAERLLLLDLTAAQRAARRLSPALDGSRLDAITDFCFNLGATRYARSTLRARVDARDWHGAAAELRKWVYGVVNGQRVRLEALVARREVTAAWMGG